MAKTGDIKISNISFLGFDVDITNASWDGREPDLVRVPAWPHKYFDSDVDPTVWHDAQKVGPGHWHVRVNTREFRGSVGNYNTNVYYTIAGKQEGYKSLDFFVPSRYESLKGGRSGFRIGYWENENVTTPTIIHEPLDPRGAKVISGELSKELNTADEFIFRLPKTNPLYQKANPIRGLVAVMDLRDNSILFYGRIVDIKGNMDSSGSFYQEITCESVLAYLHDMTMMWEKKSNKGPADILKYTLDFVNARVEDHKKMYLGRVTVPNNTDNPYIYYDFESAWDFLKRMLEKFGGYLILRPEEDGNYIDWLKEVGQHKKTPIELGKNIKSAERYISLSDMLTQIVPIGGDEESYKDDSQGTTSDNIRPRVNIVTSNPQAWPTMYIQDDELVKRFGVIRKIVEWPDITDPRLLKQRGEQYLRDQKVAMANWKVSVADRSYLEPRRYEKFELYNYHPIINAPLSGVEELQIIAIKIDLTKPQSIDLEIGASALSFSSWTLQNANAQKSVEKLNADLASERSKSEATKQQLLAQIDALNTQIAEQEKKLDAADANTDAVSAQIANLNKQIESIFNQISNLGGN